MEQQYRYYAFISYSRDDIEAAKYLKHFLEHFRYPDELVAPELKPDNPSYMRKVFLDKTELSGKSEKFEEEIAEKLKASRYLLVICSPSSAKKHENAKKHYVNWEIEEFLKTHNSDYSLIVPVVLDGEPDLSEDSCLPPAIRREELRAGNLPDFRPEKVELKKKSPDLKQNWQQGACVAVSRLLKLEREQVKDHFAEEKLRVMRQRIAIGLIALIAFAILTAWAFAAERRAAAERDRAVKAEQQATTERDRAVKAEQQATTERDRAVKAEQQATADRDRAVKAEQQATTERDRAVKAEQQATADRDRALKAMNAYEKSVDAVLAIVVVEPGNPVLKDILAKLYKQLSNDAREFGDNTKAEYYDTLSLSTSIAAIVVHSWENQQKAVNARNGKLLNKTVVNSNNNDSKQPTKMFLQDGMKLTRHELIKRINAEANVLLYESMHQTDATDVTIIHSLIKSYNDMGYSYADLCDYAFAKIYYDKSLQLAEELCRRDPANEEHAYNLLVSYWRIVICYTELRDEAQADQYAKKAQKLVDDFGKDKIYGGQKILEWINLFRQNQAARKSKNNLLIDKMREDKMSVPTAIAAAILPAPSDKDRKIAGPRIILLMMIAFAEKIQKEDPGNVENNRALVEHCKEYGDEALRDGYPFTAQLYYEKSLKISIELEKLMNCETLLDVAEKLWQRDSTSTWNARFLAVCYWNMLGCYVRMKDMARAGEYAVKIKALLEGFGVDKIRDGQKILEQIQPFLPKVEKGKPPVNTVEETR